MPESLLRKKSKKFIKKFKKAASSPALPLGGMHSRHSSPVGRFACVAFWRLSLLVRLHLLDRRHCPVSGHGWHKLGIKLIALCRSASSNCLSHRDFDGPMLGTDFCNLGICHWGIGNHKKNNYLFKNHFQVPFGLFGATLFYPQTAPLNCPFGKCQWPVSLCLFLLLSLAYLLAIVCHVAMLWQMRARVRKVQPRALVNYIYFIICIKIIFKSNGSIESASTERHIRAMNRLSLNLVVFR